jgi:hypothetical protein
MGRRLRLLVRVDWHVLSVGMISPAFFSSFSAFTFEKATISFFTVCDDRHRWALQKKAQVAIQEMLKMLSKVRGK